MQVRKRDGRYRRSTGLGRRVHFRTLPGYRYRKDGTLSEKRSTDVRQYIQWKMLGFGGEEPRGEGSMMTVHILASSAFCFAPPTYASDMLKGAVHTVMLKQTGSRGEPNYGQDDTMTSRQRRGRGLAS